MRLFNADGSPSEVSGNGVRCLAALAVRERPGTTEVTVVTPAGPKVLTLQERRGDVLTFRASMGAPQDIRAVELEAAGEKIQAVALSVGNPQCVLLDDPLIESRVRNTRPGHRASSEVSGSNQRLVREGRGARPRANSDLGARCRPDAGIRNRRLRRGRCRRDVRRRVSRCVRDFARRDAARRVARRWDLPDRLCAARLRRPLVAGLAAAASDRVGFIVLSISAIADSSFFADSDSRS